MFRSIRSATIALALAAFSGCSTTATIIDWPLTPTDQRHEIGNNYMEFQEYSGAPYAHGGVDILSQPHGMDLWVPVSVFAVADGTVNHVTTDVGGVNSQIMIGDPVSGGRGWNYGHMHADFIAVAVGDVVRRGDYLGVVADWGTENFDHIHFELVEGTGGYPWTGNKEVGNPIVWLDPNDDGHAPAFDPQPSLAIAFCANETSDYLSPTALRGQVDIIAHVQDLFYLSNWEMIPYKISVRVNSPTGSLVYSRDPAFLFDGDMGNKNTLADVVYKNDSYADSRGDYDAREFYFVVTNTDGDTDIELSDKNEAWDTTLVANGSYTVTVTAWDHRNNQASAAVAVEVVN